MYDVIFASTVEGTIGNEGGLPWDIPEDLKFFQAITTHQNLVCAHDTYKTLPESVKRRVKIIQSRKYLNIEGIEVWGNITSELLDSFGKPYIVIGGTSLFTKDIMSNARTIYHTEVKGFHHGDTAIDWQVMDQLRKMPYRVRAETSKFKIREYYGKLYKATTDSTTEGLLVS